MASHGVNGAYRVFTRLVRLAEPEEGADTWVQVPLAALDETERRVARRFQGSALEVRPQESRGEIVQAADEGLLTAWKRLSMWTVQDRQFLLWRRRLGANLSEWIQGERDAGGLLTGARLSAASRWFTERREQLTEREADFIERSIRRYEHRRRVLRVQRVVGGIGLAVLLGIGVLSYTRLRAAESRSRAAQAQYQRSLDSLRVAGLVRSGSDNTQVGNYGRAIQDFQTAIALDSANPQAYFGLGNASYQSGDLVTSVSALSEAVRTNPRYWLAYDVRARAYLETGDTTRAVADLEQVVALAPDSVRQERRQRLQQISAGRVPVDPGVTVNIRYRSRDERMVASEVQRQLGRAGFNVLAVEFREEDSRFPVRYFYPEDRQQAELVAERVRSALREVGIERVMTARLIENFRNLPRGRIEVWLPDFSGVQPPRAQVQAQGTRPQSARASGTGGTVPRATQP